MEKPQSPVWLKKIVSVIQPFFGIKVTSLLFYGLTTTVDSSSNIFRGPSEICCQSELLLQPLYIIKEKAPWGTNKNVVRDGFLLQAEPLERESTVFAFEFAAFFNTSTEKDGLEPIMANTVHI